MNITFNHTPVMCSEILKDIIIEDKGIYIDATFGSGGHTTSILKSIKKNSSILVIDKDPIAIKIAKKIASYDKRLKIYKGSFLSMKKICTKYNMIKSVNNIIVDLGTSSMQLNNKLGFSFFKNSNLDMRMNPNFGIPANIWLSKIKQKQLSNIIKIYGEEKYHDIISKAIKSKIEVENINTSFQLVKIIYNSIPNLKQNIHFATRTFQAIRIAINNELYELKKLLNTAPLLLKKGGKISIISFHSLEDRIIKNFFNSKHSHLKQIKKIKTTNEEKKENKQARSAILRVFQKIS